MSRLLWILLLLGVFLSSVGGGRIVKRQTLLVPASTTLLLPDYGHHAHALPVVGHAHLATVQQPSAALTLAAHGQARGGTPTIIGGFATLAHKVSSGHATLLDTRTISIPNFSYDGAGPDAYFVVGRGAPSAVLGRKIPNDVGSYEVLGGYHNQNIQLSLPEDLSWNDVDYLSVYCIAFRENFGQISIPKGLSLPEADG